MKKMSQYRPGNCKKIERKEVNVLFERNRTKCDRWDTLMAMCVKAKYWLTSLNI